MSVEVQVRTIVISLPAAFLNAFVHRTLRGFRFILRCGFNIQRSGLWGERT